MQSGKPNVVPGAGWEGLYEFCLHVYRTSGLLAPDSPFATLPDFAITLLASFVFRQFGEAEVLSTAGVQ